MVVRAFVINSQIATRHQCSVYSVSLRSGLTMEVVVATVPTR
jgi:hypothetical protein